MPPRRSRKPTTSFAHVDYGDLTRFARDVARTPGDIARAENAFYRASTTAIIEMARAEASMEGKLASKAAQDLSSRGLNTVVYGGKGYSRGAEFGSYRYKQFKEWRGNKDDAGYFLWPSVRQFRDREFRTQWDRTVWSTIKHDFLR